MNKLFLLFSLLVGLGVTPAHADVSSFCDKLLVASKAKAIDTTLNVMASIKGLPKYIKGIEDHKQSKRYLEYSNFGEMGLAELGIAVGYSKEKLAAMNTGRPLIIVANHHLGIADGLALQYLASHGRSNKPSLLFLARWIEKLLPHAVFGDEYKWGTAIPVEINTPKESDPEFESKMAAVKSFNSGWSRTSLRVLKSGGALIIFPAGHVAAIEKDGGKYPASVYDSTGSWTDSVLNLARMGKADIVFAHVDSVNSKDFYTKRKRFGGGDKERVIWFFSEAVAKRNKSIDVFLSEPMGLETLYLTLAKTFGYTKEALAADPMLVAELMRRYTYKVSELYPQRLDVKDLPQKIPASK